MGINKFHYDLTIVEKKAFLPADVMKVLKELEDYGFESFTIQGLSGTVERSGSDFVLAAGGSKQKYALKSSDALARLVSQGKSLLTVAGKVAQPSGDGALPTIEVTEAKETVK